MQPKNESKHKRIGIIGTVGFHVLLLLLFIFTGLTYTVPIPEQGMRINFGTSNVGSGEVQPEQVGETQEVIEEPTPVPETVTQDQPITEPIVTTNTQQTIDVPKEDEPVKDPVQEDPKPTLNDKLKETLNNAFKKGGASGGGEGNDNETGDKGQTNGTKDGGSYTGQGAGDGDGYALGNRKPLTKPKPNYTCKESGKVVILVRVNRDGETVDAQYKAKGSTTSAQCLVNQAIDAAKRTKWEGKIDAPAEQIGEITYIFELN